MESFPDKPIQPQSLKAALMIIESQERKILSLQQTIDEQEAKLRVDSKTGVTSEDHFRSVIVPKLEESMAMYRNANLAEKEKQTRHLLFFIDMDGLKKINTEQGMDAGDLAITKVAAALRKVTRKNDVLARLNSGGDEFLFLAEIRSEADLEEAEVTLMDKINDVIAQETNYELTVSFGCVWLENYDNFKAAQNMAEKREKDAKQQRYENS